MTSSKSYLSSKLLLVDVDDCILHFSDAMQDFLLSKGYSIPVRMRDHHNIPKLYDFDLATTLDLIREFHRSAAMGRLAPEPCAKDVLPLLYRQGYRFVAISACLGDPEVVKLRTENLEDAFGFKWEAVHCVGLKNCKRDELSLYPPSIWVEDMFHHAVAGAEIGHRSFIIDRLYNQNHHPLVTRVADWYELARQL